MNLPFHRHLQSVAAGSLRVWLIVGILLHVTKLRDRWQPLSYVFYTTPWPVVAAGLAVLALHARRVGHQHAVRRYIAFTLVALFTWVALSWHAAPEPAGSPSLRVVAWNTGHPVQRFGVVTGWLEKQQADLLVITESEPPDHSAPQDWARRFPDYVAVKSHGGMICLARGELKLVELGMLGLGSPYALYEVHIRGQEITLLQADITPTLARLAPLRHLAEIARKHAAEKLLVVGDLNTPRESQGFDELRGFLSHSFETSGRGFAETWPTWAPVLSLDHVWSNSLLPPRTCRIGWPMWSDHRPVIVEF